MKQLYITTTLLIVCAALSAQTTQMLTLDDCKRMAKENNNTLIGKELERRIAAQTAKEAFTHFFPTVEAGGTYVNLNEPLIEMALPNPLTGTPIAMSMMKSGKAASITAVQPLFAGGQIVNGNKLARIGKEVSDLQYEQAADEVERHTERLFRQVVQLEEKLKTIDAMDELIKQVRKDVELAIRAGVATRNDLLRVELQEHELESQRLKVENGISVTKLLLGQYIGTDGTQLQITYDAPEDPESPLIHYVDPHEAVLSRPETGLLDRNLHAGRLQKRIEIGKRLPSVGIGGGYFYNDLMGSDKNFGMIFANVKIPISDWWGGSHAIKKQAWKLKQAEIERINGMELMVVQTEQAWNELQEAYKQTLVAKRSIASASENMRVNREGYKAGTVTLTDVLDAQSLLQQSRDKQTEALTNYGLKLTEYRLLTGR